MRFSSGTRLGVYELISALGEGGMGEVYRAHDTRLGRDVALKVLHPDVADDPARLERFTREARAVAALNHPHIVTLYSTEEADGVRFMTMELVEGHALDAVIPAGGMTIPRFLEIALPLADALIAAHQKQITHRDLKPSNVMVTTEGRVKVLDFGLARFGETVPSLDKTTVKLTEDGAVVGTLPYMSPEQVQGGTPDARSDLFSLGVMFYEMLTGVRPFRGPSSAAVLTAILRDMPAPVHEQRPDVPETLARLVGRCLEKHADERIQTARDVFNELRHVQRQLDSGGAAQPRPGSGTMPRSTALNLRVAVLPFLARSSDPQTRELAEGLTDDLTTGLGRFPYLRVVSQTAKGHLPSEPIDSHKAASILGARFVIEGTVRHAGGTVRVTARLTDAETGAHLWAESFDRDLAAGMFAVQDDIAARTIAQVADASGALVRTMAATLAETPLQALAAADLIIKFFSHIERFQADEHAALRTAFEHAVEREPHNATAWACLSNLYAQEYELGYNVLPDTLARQQRAAERSIAVDVTSQYGWMSLAVARYLSADMAAARQAAERAIGLNPLNTPIVAYMGLVTALSGDRRRGLELVQRSLALNPNLPGHIHFVPFLDHYVRGDYEAALLDAKRINIPHMQAAHLAMIAAAGQLGRVDDARNAFESLRRLNADTTDAAAARRVWERLVHDPPIVDRLVEGYEKAIALVR